MAAYDSDKFCKIVWNSTVDGTKLHQGEQMGMKWVFDTLAFFLYDRCHNLSLQVFRTRLLVHNGMGVQALQDYEEDGRLCPHGDGMSSRSPPWEGRRWAKTK